MNPDRTPEDEAAVQEVLADLKRIRVSATTAAAKGQAALPRLVEVALGHSGQSGVVLRWLASVYNGSEAPAVELDEIRRLDWSLREDLLAVILGCAQGDFSDVQIRHAFDAAGGQEAVDRLHAITCNNAQVLALSRLVQFIRSHQGDWSTKGLRSLLASTLADGATCELSRLESIDEELRNDAFTVIDALYGRNRGKLYVENVREALENAGLLP
jgi:hypothetical protein